MTPNDRPKGEVAGWDVHWHELAKVYEAYQTMKDAAAGPHDEAWQEPLRLAQAQGRLAISALQQDPSYRARIHRLALQAAEDAKAEPAHPTRAMLGYAALQWGLGRVGIEDSPRPPSRPRPRVGQGDDFTRSAEQDPLPMSVQLGTEQAIVRQGDQEQRIWYRAPNRSAPAIYIVGENHSFTGGEVRREVTRLALAWFQEQPAGAQLTSQMFKSFINSLGKQIASTSYVIQKWWRDDFKTPSGESIIQTNDPGRGQKVYRLNPNYHLTFNADEAVE